MWLIGWKIVGFNRSALAFAYPEICRGERINPDLNGTAFANETNLLAGYCHIGYQVDDRNDLEQEVHLNGRQIQAWLA